MGRDILQFETPLLDRLPQVLSGQPEFLGAPVLKTALRKFGGQVVLLKGGAVGAFEAVDPQVALRTCLSFLEVP